MIRLFPLLLAALFITVTTFGQETLNWKKQRKLADKLFESHQYLDAAVQYEGAWQQQPKELELIYKAGECYALIKDFKKTIQTLQHVYSDNNRFPLVGLKYARALKQDGQYQKAKDAFVYFIKAYQGTDREVDEGIVANELAGCEQGIVLAKNATTSNIKVKHLNENINSLAIEFAPIPYTDDLLYYSSTRKNHQAFLFRSQRKNGTWNKSVVAEGLPNFSDKHFANGSFAPNAKSFYFTLCDNGEGLDTKCEIYVLNRVGAKWSEPIRLRDYINVDNATTTQPWVVHKDGQEILYFASDREGGFGEMDIWYCTRSIESGDIDFTYPINLGSEINTIGDEITPFYDLVNNTLYYSSNGKVTLGGWDIFKSKGGLSQWESAQNLGAPINSSADDFYYVLKPSGTGGFLASNRLYGAEKISTQDEDIFEFGVVESTNKFYALGQIMDAETMLPVRDVRISLYELDNGRAKLLSSKKVAQSNYRFQILPNKNLRLVAEKMGYLKNVFDFNSFNTDGSLDYTHIFSLNKRDAIVAASQESNSQNTATYTASADNEIGQVTNNSTSSLATNSSPVKNKTTSSAKVKVSSASPTSANNARTETGIQYKVQVTAVNYHNINHPRYEKVKQIGIIETEQIAPRGITRVMITDLPDKKSAEEIRQQAIGFGFVDAFLVKYKDGKRIGRIW